MSWQVFKLKEGEHGFRVVGYGVTLDGELWQGGAMKNDPYWGLKALEHPACRPRVLRSWKVAAPRYVSGLVNVGADRRFLRFEARDAAPFVLRFQQYVPAELIAALKIAFAGPDRKEITDEVPPADPVLDPPGAPERHLPRRPVGGEDRQPPEDGQHPGDQRLEEGRQVARPKPKPRKKGRKAHVRRTRKQADS